MRKEQLHRILAVIITKGFYSKYACEAKVDANSHDSSLAVTMPRTSGKTRSGYLE